MILGIRSQMKLTWVFSYWVVISHFLVDCSVFGKRHDDIKLGAYTVAHVPTPTECGIMFNKKFTIFHWIWLWGLLTLMFAWLTDTTKSSLTFWATMFTAAVLLVTVVAYFVKVGIKKRNIKNIWACYLIPRKIYNSKVKYENAPTRKISLES